MNKLSDHLTREIIFDQTGNSPRKRCTDKERSASLNASRLPWCETVFNHFPSELHFHIFKQLCHEDLSSFSQTCKAVHELFQGYMLSISCLWMTKCPDTLAFRKKLETLTSLKQVDLQGLNLVDNPSDLFECLNKLPLLDRISIRIVNDVVIDINCTLPDNPYEDILYSKDDNSLRLTYVMAYHLEELFTLEKFKQITTLKIENLSLPIHGFSFHHFSHLVKVSLVNPRYCLLQELLSNIYLTPSVKNLDITTSEMVRTSELISWATLHYRRGDIVVTLIGDTEPSS